MVLDIYDNIIIIIIILIFHGSLFIIKTNIIIGQGWNFYIFLIKYKHVILSIFILYIYGYFITDYIYLQQV